MLFLFPWLGSVSGDSHHWGAQSSSKGSAEALCWSWAIPGSSGKPAPLQPPNQDLGEKELFPRATSPPELTEPQRGWDFAVTNEQHKSPLREDEAGIACLWSALGSLVRGGGREPSLQPDPVSCAGMSPPRRGWDVPAGESAGCAQIAPVTEPSLPCRYRDGSQHLTCQWPLPRGCVSSGLMNRHSTAGSSEPRGPAGPLMGTAGDAGAELRGAGGWQRFVGGRGEGQRLGVKNPGI